MSFRTKVISVFAALAFFLCAACGPTYVQPVAVQQQQYVPAYDPNQAVYDAALTVAILNGVNGYYGPGHVFYPMATYGGVSGYYDSGHHFHTSVTNKTVIVNNYNNEIKQHQAQVPTGKPNYSAQTPAQQQSQAQQAAGKPNYGAQQGTIGRGAATTPAPATAATPVQSKPNYQSATGGSIGRGAATTAAPAPVVSSKPNYGASQGSIQRSAPAPSPKPSFSSSSGSMGRRK